VIGHVLGHTEPDQAGPDHPGPDRTVPDRTGLDHETAGLQRAARRAFAHGNFAQATEYLESAAERCRTEEQLLSVRIQLAETYWYVRPTDSARDYLSLKAPALAGKLTDGQALRVVTGMLWHLQMDDAVEVINHFPGQAGPDGEPASPGAYYAQLLISASFPGIRDRLRRRGGDGEGGGGWRGQPGPVPATPNVQAARTLVAVLTGTADEDTIGRAEELLGGEAEPSHDRLHAIWMAMLSVIYADRIEVAATWCDRVLAGTAAGQEDREWALISTLGALIALRQGRLDVAAERAGAALSYYTSGRGWCVELGLILATLVEAHTAMGEYDVAAGHLRHPVPPAMFQTRSGLHYLFARGRHHLATGDRHAALGDFMACGERMTRWGMDTPALVPWRVGAAEAWLSLDETARAARLAEEQMTQLGAGLSRAGLSRAGLSRAGVPRAGVPQAGLPRASGVTLRCLAAATDIAQRPTILRKAQQLLQQCGDRYERARVLCDLSRAYRTLGARTEARTAARRAWRLAKVCHAEVLCEDLAGLCRELSPIYQGDTDRADTDQAGVSVADPRSAERQPPLLPEGELAKLSTKERRVALLAAEGYSNREISSKLLVTVSTVEQHLTRIYRKMNIKSRYELVSGFLSGPAGGGGRESNPPTTRRAVPWF
jgi:DNA-binding CsgD family transcriptional regulator